MTRSPRPTTRALLALALAGALLAPPRAARADEIDACKAAAEQAEALRAESRLRAAKERLLACAQDACPRVIRDACTVGFADVERILPTIVLRARDARGHDVLGVRVRVDGAPLVPRLTGVPVAVDPGPHRLRYEAAGGEAYDETVLIAQGERDRVITITFASALDPDGFPPGASEPPVERPSARPSLVPAALTAALGAVGVGTFTVLDLQAWSDYRALRDANPCAASKTCDTGSIRSTLVVADVALAVGIVSLGAAVLLALPHFRAPAPAAALAR